MITGNHVGMTTTIPAPSVLSVTKIGARIGAVVDDVELSGSLDREIVEDIRRAIAVHKVLVVRGQHHLTDEEQYNFVSLLGSPTTPHPTVRSRGTTALQVDSRYGKANSWHSDVTFVDRIPKITTLRAVELPPYGGSTTFASTVAAYESLPEPLRVLADNLWALHSNAYDYAAEFAEKAATSDIDNYRKEFESTLYETEHPVVRIHPETGERALLLGHFVKKILGVSTKESQALFNLLQDRITRLENTIRWNWSLGDIVLWDNRATQHYAVDDYDDQPRKLSRVTLAGDIPVSVTGETSRVVTGDAAEYSVIDEPVRLAG